MTSVCFLRGKTVGIGLAQVAQHTAHPGSNKGLITVPLPKSAVLGAVYLPFHVSHLGPDFGTVVLSER